MTGRLGGSPRYRPILMSFLLLTAGLTVQAAPTTLPIPRPEALAPQPASALGCGTNPLFTGRLTASSSSHAAVSAITSPTVYGYISNVDRAWSCTSAVRYSGVAWNTTLSKGTFDWGLLIQSTSVSCNWAVGSNDYLKANNTSDCPDTDAEYAMAVTLAPEMVYQQDNDHDLLGDFSFVHSDCDTFYGKEPIQLDRTFNGGNANNRPGNNCDPLTIDGTGTSQTITYDKTAPTGTSISIAAGAASTASNMVSLGSLAADDDVSGVADMRFSNNGALWSGWETYQATRPTNWDLTSATYGGTAGDGTKTVYVQFQDANGNGPSAAISDTIVLDTTGPDAPSTPDLDPASDTGVSDVDDITSDSTPTFNGTAEADSTVTIYDDANVVGSGIATGGVWSITTSTLPEGVRSITASATDATGNPSAASAALTVTIDVTAPAAPSVPDLDAGSDTGSSDTDDITTDTTPTFSGTAEPDVTVTLYDAETSVGSGLAAGGSWSITTSELGIGESSVSARAMDTAGNSSAMSDALTVSIVESDLELSWPIEGAVLFGTELFEIDSADPDATSVDYIVDGQVVATANGAPFAASWDTTSDIDGTHTVQAQTHSPSGISLSPVVTITVDNALPSTERLEIDYDSGHLTADQYAIQGVYAVAAPLVLPERYQSTGAGATDPNQIGTYLALWDSLSQAAQDEIDNFLSQPLRGTFYAASVFPSTFTAVQPPQGITDSCEYVETREPITLIILGTKLDCIHETPHFEITYVISGDDWYAADSVDATQLMDGTPALVKDYADGLEDAYSVYVDDLGYAADWQGKVPVEVGVPPCGEGCGFTAPHFGSDAATVMLSPTLPTPQPHYLAHHELFHVFQWHMLTAGSYAWFLSPTGGVMGPWQFLVVTRVERRLGGQLRVPSPVGG